MEYRYCLEADKSQRPSGRTAEARRDTDLDVGAFRLHEFADDFAQLVGVGELAQGGGRREGRIRAGGRGYALGGIHLMEAATEGGNLLCALQGVRGSERERDTERERGKGDCIKKCATVGTAARCEGKGPAIDQPAGVTFYLLSGHIHDCARVRLQLRHRSSSKKKKIICTNLVYFQAVITMTLHLPPSLPLTHSLTRMLLLPRVFSLSATVTVPLFHRIQNIHTTLDCP